MFNRGMIEYNYKCDFPRVLSSSYLIDAFNLTRSPCGYYVEIAIKETSEMITKYLVIKAYLRPVFHASVSALRFRVPCPHFVYGHGAPIP